MIRLATNHRIAYHVSAKSRRTHELLLARLRRLKHLDLGPGIQLATVGIGLHRRGRPGGVVRVDTFGQPETGRCRT